MSHLSLVSNLLWSLHKAFKLTTAFSSQMRFMLKMFIPWCGFIKHIPIYLGKKGQFAKDSFSMSTITVNIHNNKLLIYMGLLHVHNLICYEIIMQQFAINHFRAIHCWIGMPLFAYIVNDIDIGTVPGINCRLWTWASDAVSIRRLGQMVGHGTGSPIA